MLLKYSSHSLLKSTTKLTANEDAIWKPLVLKCILRGYSLAQMKNSNSSFRDFNQTQTKIILF